MNILIIGGTGTISTPITQFLLERGDAVTLYNRGRTEARIPSGAVVLHGDRNDFAVFEPQMQGAGPFDCVIDMVCYTPEQAQSLVRAVAGRTRQVIVCSTVDVYTKPVPVYPYCEKDAPRDAVGSYGQNKVRCEDILMEAHRRGDFAVTSLRPAHTYGDTGSIIHTFGWGTYHLDRLRRGLPVIAHGDGSSLWAACHADDVARGFVNAIGNERVFGKAYHLTGEEWMTWNQYHAAVAEALGGPPPTLIHIPTDLLVRWAPEQAGACGVNFQFNNIYDNSAARTDLGFRYAIPFAEGSQRTVSWLQEHGRIEASESQPFYDRLIAAWEQLGASQGGDDGRPAQ